MRYINGTRLDDRIVRTDWDAGFVEGRQYGRGKTGGQVSWLFIYSVELHQQNQISCIKKGLTILTSSVRVDLKTLVLIKVKINIICFN